MRSKKTIAQATLIGTDQLKVKFVDGLEGTIKIPTPTFEEIEAFHTEPYGICIDFRIELPWDYIRGQIESTLESS